jgi:hypothetical protein
MSRRVEEGPGRRYTCATCERPEVVAYLNDLDHFCMEDYL